MKRNPTRSRDWILSAALVTVALASIAWIYSADRDVDDDAPQAQRLPAVQMDDFVVQSMDAQGRLKQRLEGRRLVQFAVGSEIDAPYLTLYDTHQKSVWRIQSDSGTAPASGDEVLLFGNVHIWRGGIADRDRIDIYTQDLRVLPQAQYAETRAPVRIHTRKSELQSNGARVYLNTRKIELPAAVKHIYRNLEKLQQDGGLGVWGKGYD